MLDVDPCLISPPLKLQLTPLHTVCLMMEKLLRCRVGGISFFVLLNRVHPHFPHRAPRFGHRASLPQWAKAVRLTRPSAKVASLSSFFRSKLARNGQRDPIAPCRREENRAKLAKHATKLLVCHKNGRPKKLLVRELVVRKCQLVEHQLASVSIRDWAGEMDKDAFRKERASNGSIVCTSRWAGALSSQGFRDSTLTPFLLGFSSIHNESITCKTCPPVGVGNLLNVMQQHCRFCQVHALSFICTWLTWCCRKDTPSKTQTRAVEASALQLVLKRISIKAPCPQI